MSQGAQLPGRPARRTANKILGSVLFALTALSLVPAFAQIYPSKPIKLVIGFTPGGASDSIFRAIQTPLELDLGQPIVADYKPGAGGSIAAEYIG